MNGGSGSNPKLSLSAKLWSKVVRRGEQWLKMVSTCYRKWFRSTRFWIEHPLLNLHTRFYFKPTIVNFSFNKKKRLSRTFMIKSKLKGLVGKSKRFDFMLERGWIKFLSSLHLSDRHQETNMKYFQHKTFRHKSR